MFQNLLMTGLAPLCNTNEIQNWDNRPFNGKWPEGQRSPVRGSEVKRTIKKKPKRNRTAYSTDQIRALEKIYSTTKYIDAKRRKQLAETLKIGDKALKIWFQNRRMKEKKESSESSCDTSTEIVSCQSPTTDIKSAEPTVDAHIPYPNYGQFYDPEQYQFPSFYYQNGATGQFCHNEYSYDPNNINFGVDSSVYPTQYYPTESQYNNAGLNVYGQVQHAYEVDNCYTKSYGFNYYNTQQV